MKEEKFWVLLAKKLAGEATPAELEELQYLLSTNPEWKANMETLKELWTSKPAKPGKYSQKAEDAYLAHVNRLKGENPDFAENDQQLDSFKESFTTLQKSRPFYKRWVTLIAAAVVVTAIVLIYPLLNTDNKAAREKGSQLNEISIRPGSRTKIQLPDGSQVWINSGSKLTYEGTFSGTNREVHLDGEAYFDVVKDAAHPFIVHTSGIDIKVLGTAFNVKAYKVEPTIEATLIHGSIEVLNKNQPDAPRIMLKPHEKLVYNKVLAGDVKELPATATTVKQEPDASSITIRPLAKSITDSAIAETAWVYNKLIFEDERFDELVLRMERWYDLKINIENDKLKNFRISGSFVNETVEEALKELQLLVPFNFSISKNEIKIMRK
jgi:transmembrane sensor